MTGVISIEGLAESGAGLSAGLEGLEPAGVCAVGVGLATGCTPKLPPQAASINGSKAMLK
ncbi:hypothetical protein [Neisseria lactamica]|uniref:hypothetical protein n=1 Tax=Neisseria lactamica TaxID=486 RepID=UPI0027E09B1B|nr:hypothetical protein [Neisseria lactamica]